MANVSRADRARVERLDVRTCYACGRGIGFLQALFRPRVATFESAFDGLVSAGFCGRACERDAVENAAAVRKSFPPPPPDSPLRSFEVIER